MRFLLAPDSFKGSLTSRQAVQAMARGLRAVFPEAWILECPVADGGEGTVDALLAATGGTSRCTRVRGPLGDPVEAIWGVLGDGRTAVIEAAAASGLGLVPEERRDPRLASTFGTGELVKAALDAGFRRILLGLGGTGTNDGGAGFARALGARFLDAEGLDLPEGGAALAGLARVDARGLDPRLRETEFLVASDVDSPLCGPRGATAVFGPQKGLAPEGVQALDAALGNLARIASRDTGREVADRSGAGAAGGLGAGLLWFTSARIRSGVEVFLEASGFEARLRAVDLVFTGEGRTDAQTSLGKAPLGVAAAARRQGIPVVCLSGALGEGAEALLDCGMTALASVPPGPMALEACMAEAAALLEAATRRVARLIHVGMSLGAG
ncbi:MAG: glycerate kinase [Acidobacteriota bacterium]|nr:glycerate kinase [Acidobacteriota bacterium]